MTATQQTITVDAAQNRLRADYWEDVRAIIEDARHEISGGHLDRDRDSIREYLEQTVDGHQRVIYTYQALLTLTFASNHDAYTEEYGAIPTTGGCQDNGDVDWSALAYAAMLADVMEQASAESLFDAEEETDDDEETGA